MTFFLILRGRLDICGHDWTSAENWTSVWPSGSEHRFYDDHNREVDGSTPTQASL